MRFETAATVMATIIGLAMTPVFAAPKGGAQTHAPAAKSQAPQAGVTKTTKAPQTPHSTTTTTHVDKTPKGSGAPTTTKTSHTGKPTTTAHDTHDVKGPKGAKTTTSASTLTSTSTTTPTTTPTTTTVDFSSTPVGAKLSKNSALRSKVESRLTTLGYKGTVYEAAYGFKNQGQFVAATNVARNLGISFDQLKLQMTGLSVAPDGTVLRANLGPDGKITMVDPKLATNPAPTRSLGQSIQTVKSTVNSTDAAKTATTQADAEIAASSSTSTVASR